MDASKKTNKNSGFGNRLAELVRQRGLSLNRLARDLGVAPSTVLVWTRGGVPNGTELLSLARRFGVSMEWLLDGTPGMPISEDVSAARPRADLPADELKDVLQNLSANVANLQALAQSAMAGRSFKVSFAPPDDLGSMPYDIARSDPKLMLTKKATSGNLPDMSVLPELRTRLMKATEARGKKSELARFLGVPLSSVSRWLSGNPNPNGETTLRLLQWVEQEERQQQPQSPGSATTPPGPKTRNRKPK